MFRCNLSHSVWSEWIEISAIVGSMRHRGRTPYGVRVLKFRRNRSVPALHLRRTPYGVRGLKYDSDFIGIKHSGRTPYGVRGLKYISTEVDVVDRQVALR